MYTYLYTRKRVPGVRKNGFDHGMWWLDFLMAEIVGTGVMGILVVWV